MTGGQHLLEISTVKFSESPLTRNIDLLTTGELEFCTPKSLNYIGLMTIAGPYRHDCLTNIDTSDETLGLAESTSHSSLEPISSGTRQHLVDSVDKELVGTDTASLKGFRGKLFIFIRH